MSYIKIFRLKFTGLLAIDNQEYCSYNRGDNEFNIINKFEQWLCFVWSFVIVMDSTIIFTIIIHWKKSSSKMFMPSIFSTHMFQGFWEIQQYFILEAVFKCNWQIKKIWDFLNISHQVSDFLFSTVGYYSKIQMMTATVCVKCFSIFCKFMCW